MTDQNNIPASQAPSADDMATQPPQATPRATEETRLPNRRYLGDGVYAGHDGTSLFLETSNGIEVSNRIVLDGSTLDAMNHYIDYLNEFYGNDQHLVPPVCEDCGADIRDYRNPLTGAIRGEIYGFRREEKLYEVRLCRECAKTVDEAFLIAVIEKRTPAVHD